MSTWEKFNEEKNEHYPTGCFMHYYFTDNSILLGLDIIIRLSLIKVLSV